MPCVRFPFSIAKKKPFLVHSLYIEAGFVGSDSAIKRTQFLERFQVETLKNHVPFHVLRNTPHDAVLLRV